LLGLMFRKRLGLGEALLIDPCGSVHTFFMRFPIDVVFLDKDDRVLKVAAELRPYRFAFGSGSKRVLEMAAGSAASVGLNVGDQLTFAESDPLTLPGQLNAQ
jgi:uncharacterized membrane protein (UPF0127 family)